MTREKNLPLIHETRTYFTFAELHQDIAQAVFPDIRHTSFHEATDDEDHDDDCDDEYSTYVMGKFRCTNEACETPAWSSKMVTILIRRYSGNGYSALVYNQRCKVCDQLGTFRLHKRSYVERIAYRLKKWGGVATTPQVFRERTGPRHEQEFCEGCKRGICRQTSNFGFY